MNTTQKDLRPFQLWSHLLVRNRESA